MLFSPSMSRGRGHNDVRHGGPVWTTVCLTAYSLTAEKTGGNAYKARADELLWGFLVDDYCLGLLADTNASEGLN